MAAGARHEAVATPTARAGVVLHAAPDAPTGLRGTFAIAARADPGLMISTRSAGSTRRVSAAWGEFAADGRLEPTSTAAQADRRRRSRRAAIAVDRHARSR